MSSDSDNAARRRFLAVSLSLAAMPAAGFPTLGKEKIQNFGKVYDYLKNGHLRAKELGSQPVSVENAVFADATFQNTSWQYFDFVDCEFTSQYKIKLDWLTDSTFTNCSFKGIFMFGNAVNVRFIKCSMKGRQHALFLSKSTNLVFEDCKFINPDLYDYDRVGSVMSRGEILFMDCMAEGFDLSGHKKLTLRRCTTRGSLLKAAYPGEYRSEMPYSDYLLEDCDFRGGAYVKNNDLNSLTLRNCKLGVFETAGSVVKGDVLVENITEGHLDLSASTV
ncbi:MAG: right-handed parallel beta-helix repeat-containing protein, partial [Zoogloeaceae bacterium]|nr:right-handed parallel beta-helix repeat-containing protein [Zoogloeaceae bacterium]